MKRLMFIHTSLFPQINLDQNFGFSYPVSWYGYSVQKNCVQIEWDFREIWTAQTPSKILYFMVSILKSKFIKAMLTQWTNLYVSSRCQDIFIFLTTSLFYFMLLFNFQHGKNKQWLLLWRYTAFCLWRSFAVWTCHLLCFWRCYLACDAICFCYPLARAPAFIVYTLSKDNFHPSDIYIVNKQKKRLKRAELSYHGRTSPRLWQHSLSCTQKPCDFFSRFLCSKGYSSQSGCEKASH